MTPEPTLTRAWLVLIGAANGLWCAMGDEAGMFLFPSDSQATEEVAYARTQPRVAHTLAVEVSVPTAGQADSDWAEASDEDRQDALTLAAENASRPAVPVAFLFAGYDARSGLWHIPTEGGEPKFCATREEADFFRDCWEEDGREKLVVWEVLTRAAGVGERVN